MNAVYNLGLMLQPFIPFTTKKLFKILNINSDSINWKYCSELKVKSGHKINKPKILFDKIENELIQKQKNKLGKESIKK